MLPIVVKYVSFAAAIVRLEKQYTRGRDIYLEIKHVVQNQKALVEDSKSSLSAARQKLEKYTKMCTGLSSSIDEMKTSISALKPIMANK
jgi:predicted  nucleic acid-binding Zn-ribbon protein